MLNESSPTLGELIREKRLLLGWNQQKLARRLDRSIATVSALETDQRLPSAEMILAIAEVTGIAKRRIVAHMMRRHGGKRWHRQ